MFDLLMRDAAGAGVPVPLPGRGLVYLGLDGLLYVKQSGGAVMALPSGPQGLQGLPGVQGAPGAVSENATTAAISVPFSTTAAQVVTANAAAIWAGGCIEFDVSGLYTKTSTAANMIATIYAGSLLVASLSITLGTTARTNAAWSYRGSLRVSGGVAVMQLVGRADFVTQPAPVGKDWGANLIAGREVLSIYLATNTATATLKSAGGQALRVL